MNDWQSWAAAGIVIVTIGIFLLKAVRGRSRSGDCDDCSCGK